MDEPVQGTCTYIDSGMGKKTLEKMELGKAVGCFNIFAEMLKAVGGRKANLLTELSDSAIN